MSISAEKKLAVFEILRKLCNSQDTYLSLDSRGHFVVDGCLEVTEEEKKLLEETLLVDKL